MKYSLFAAVLLAMFLVGCGGEKPGQYPPSLYEDPDSGERLGAPSGGNPDRK